MQDSPRPGMRLMDRAEYDTKPDPLTRPPEATVAEAVTAMNAHNYGSVIVVDGDNKPVGLMTERDVMRKVVDGKRDPQTTPLSEVMTTELRLARETDDLLNWLRMMSNERFRRLPVVDAEGRIKAVFTQGDFVSYTWPDLLHQGRQIARASLSRNFTYVLIGGGILLYLILMMVVLMAL
ncbi:CBS domain-containing protein [Psychromarinibacter sp. C21-152]|uniref:CBS domain-containing protein n=1 Tax=Psychromarinibacter sediminicola TaxID=3033385 RepID=A0AAE3NTZ1_9RHOB|nr:CBS domain-containing protein [Psychromarinibacter sediminicola]MDF0600900.1 CBS domain-containing protein [Psychromarinibacter sediminicola]